MLKRICSSGRPGSPGDDGRVGNDGSEGRPGIGIANAISRSGNAQFDTHHTGETKKLPEADVGARATAVVMSFPTDTLPCSWMFLKFANSWSSFICSQLVPPGQLKIQPFRLAALQPVTLSVNDADRLLDRVDRDGHRVLSDACAVEVVRNVDGEEVRLLRTAERAAHVERCERSAIADERSASLGDAVRKRASGTTRQMIRIRVARCACSAPALAARQGVKHGGDTIHSTQQLGINASVATRGCVAQRNMRLSRFAQRIIEAIATLRPSPQLPLSSSGGNATPGAFELLGQLAIVRAHLSDNALDLNGQRNDLIQDTEATLAKTSCASPKADAAFSFLSPGESQAGSRLPSKREAPRQRRGLGLDPAEHAGILEIPEQQIAATSKCQRCLDLHLHRR